MPDDPTTTIFPEDIKIIQLRRPLKLGSLPEVTQLVLHEPTAGDLEKVVSTNPHTSNIMLISAVTKIPAQLVQQLPAAEYQEAVDYLSGFLLAGRRTGGTS